jgi:hypothetical protein
MLFFATTMAFPTHYLHRGDIEMTKKVLVALTLLVMALFATNSFGQACSSGVNAQFVGAGSSAQFNTFAYAAKVSLALPNFWTTTAGQLQDTRYGTPPVDSGLTAWVAWDGNNVCNVYAYFSIDSAIGVKDFFATAKSVAPGKGVYGAVFGVPGTWTSAAGANAVPGITDTGALPANLQTFLTTSPAPTTATQIPQPGCGQIGTLGGTTIYCFFNAGFTDIRPEDALYATARALSSYSTTSGLSGLGYNQATCGFVDSNQGCPIYDSFKKGKIFQILNFKLTGTDPKTTATVPVYTTLSTGAAPIVVLVSNTDTGSLGLGSTTSGSYNFTNINRAVLSNVFQGTTSCSGDLLPSPQGAGQPLDIIVREPLSGTYNTFEFTAVRTLAGSAATTVKQNQISTKTWISNDSSGQEFDPFGNLTLGPATNFTDTTNCDQTSGNRYATGAVACGDPLYNPLNTCGTGSVTAYKARGIGTGEEVKATLGLDNVSGGLSVSDGIGYAFWSYQNFAPSVVASGCATAASGDVSCGSYLGHYLTVDGIDPLFPNAGTPVDASSATIPGGAYNLPQCGAVTEGASSTPFPCQQIPFTHVLDGSYPLWSQLRFVTMANVTGKQVTPAGAINMLAAAETEAVDASFQLSDFVPLLKNVSGSYKQGLGAVTTSGTHVTWVSGDPFDTTWTGSIVINGATFTITTVTSTTAMTVTPAPPTHSTQVPYDWNSGTPPKGDLNLGVFRSHYVQSAINGYNGHANCGSYTGIQIVGGTGTVGNTCLVDLGGDMGGSVLTVQSDTDFNADFGGVGVNPAELYGQHQ